GSMRFAHSNRGGATGAWPGNADTVSEEGSRFHASPYDVEP
ncbi:hypothetical protein J2S06_003235, partial [Bacillus alveayuensis]|nr:hypothetical protein [Bacillus alveayuensis]